jgi:hypothetical protein
MGTRQFWLGKTVPEILQRSQSRYLALAQLLTEGFSKA